MAANALAPHSAKAQSKAHNREIALAALRGAKLAPASAQPYAFAAAILPLGDQAVCARFPEGGLRRGALHELAPQTHWDQGAAVGFCLGACARALRLQAGPMVWIGRPHGDFGAPYGLGLAGFGLDPRQVLWVCPPRLADRFWATEEVLRSGAARVVLAQLEGDGLDLVATRRLQLAAENGGSLVLLLRGPSDAPIALANSRWRVAARPASHWGQGSCRMQLMRARSLPAGAAAFDLEWQSATNAFHLAAILGHSAAGFAGAPSQTGFTGLALGAA